VSLGEDTFLGGLTGHRPGRLGAGPNANTKGEPMTELHPDIIHFLRILKRARDQGATVRSLARFSGMSTSRCIVGCPMWDNWSNSTRAFSIGYVMTLSQMGQQLHRRGPLMAPYLAAR
jgi:hypothetical protein